jgi:diaminopimelate decarboxylase
MLKPLIDPVISTLINKFPGTLADLVKQHGSP